MLYAGGRESEVSVTLWEQITSLKAGRTTAAPHGWHRHPLCRESRRLIRPTGPTPPKGVPTAPRGSALASRRERRRKKP